MKYCMLFLVTVSLLGLSSCKVPNHPVSATLKSAYYYQRGTYWIYQETTTGAIDSFYVADIRLSNHKGQPHHQYTFDVIELDISSVRIDTPVLVTNASWYLQMEENYYFFGFNMKYWVSAVNWAEYSNDYIHLAYPAATYADGADTVKLIGPYLLNGNSFENAAMAHLIEQPGNPSSRDDSFFLDPNVFMTRMVLNDSLDGIHRDYRLLRWHIER